MTEYSISVFGALALFGLLSLICYGTGKVEKTALGIITAFIIISPLVNMIWGIDISSALDSIVGGEYETDADPAYVAEEAFAKGIKETVAERFMINKEDIRVKIINFNMENMSCEQIRIYLEGAGVLNDYRGIESYVNGLGMGECKVEIDFGKRE